MTDENPDIPSLPKLLTIPQAANLLGISHKTITAAAKRGAIEVVRIRVGGWPYVTEQELLRWIESCKERST